MEKYMDGDEYRNKITVQVNGTLYSKEAIDNNSIASVETHIETLKRKLKIQTELVASGIFDMEFTDGRK